MIKIPIYFGFNTQEQMGFVELDEAYLPSNPMWTLDPVYVIDGTGNYTLTDFGLAPNAKSTNKQIT